MKSKIEYYRVDRRQIAYIKFILEAHDGVAVLETIDSHKGIVLFYIAPGCEQQFRAILRDLSIEIMIRPLHKHFLKL